MNARAQPLTEAADGKPSYVPFSSEDGVRVSRIERTGIIERGERSIRKYFEHPMATYAAALAYRGLFSLFPFLLILVVLVGALGFPDFFDRLIEQARSGSSQQVPQQLEPVVEQGREQIQPLEEMIGQAQKRAGGELLFFGIVVALWSVSSLSRTLTEAFNAAYEVGESRSWWKGLLLSLAFGPVLALLVIVATGLMLIGPQLVERIAEVVGAGELFVSLWGWLRFPVALFVLGVALCVVYRYSADAKQRFRTVVLGATLAAVLWAISSIGFSFYLANFANYGLTYGSLGVAVGLLFYLYLCASVVLLGAEVNATTHHLAPDRVIEVEEPGWDNETAGDQGSRTRDV
jgi:membrane protein